mgnify:CR=1 FL=1
MHGHQLGAAEEQAVDVIEAVLLGHQQQPIEGNDADSRRRCAIQRLHKKAGEPDLVREVVEELEKASLLGYTDLNLCYKYLFEQR